MGAENEIIVNLYGNIESAISINKNNKVLIEQVSDYPKSDRY